MRVIIFEILCRNVCECVCAQTHVYFLKEKVHNGPKFQRGFGSHTHNKTTGSQPLSGQMGKRSLHKGLSAQQLRDTEGTRKKVL